MMAEVMDEDPDSCGWLLVYSRVRLCLHIIIKPCSPYILAADSNIICFAVVMLFHFAKMGKRSFLAVIPHVIPRASTQAL